VVFLKKRQINWMQGERNVTQSTIVAKQASEPGENNREALWASKFFKRDLSEVESQTENCETMTQCAKILGDQFFNDFIKDVKVTQLLGMPYSFKYVTTMSSLALEIDPNGTETIMIIGCLNSILDSFYLDDSGKDIELQFDKMRLMFDSYLSRVHQVIYVCQPVGRPTSRITEQYQSALNQFMVMN
jgi:hypothetical protein